MGFCWSANVEIVFGATVAIPIHTARVVKRLALWQPPDGTLFEKAAKRIRDFSQVPETVRKRAKVAANPAVDYTEIPEDAEWEAYAWSDVPDEIDEETQAVLDKLKEYTLDSGGAPDYHPESTFDLEYNYPELFNQSFQLAARRLFGSDDHGLELTFDSGSVSGNVDDEADEQLMMVTAEYVRPCKGLDAPRGEIGGVPWGCLATPIPTDRDMEAKRAKIEAAVKAFGFRVEKPTGWYLVTVADGG